MTSRGPHTVAWALGLSAAVHLAVFAGMAWLAATNAFAFWSASPWSEPADKPEEILLVAEAEPPAPQPAEEFIRTDGQPNAAKPPDRSHFHSDRNTAAASNLPPDPTGIKDAPSQEGIDVPVIEVVKQKLIEGEGTEAVPAEIEPPAPSPASAAEVVPVRSIDKPPTPAPVEQMDPARPVEKELSPTAEVLATTPESDTVIPLNRSSAVDPVHSLREPTAEVRDQLPEKDLAANIETSATPPAPATTPRAPAAPRFQSQSELTKLRGTISTQGVSSVEAADTAVGRYMKEVTSAIEKEWHRKRRRYADFVTYGTIRLEFCVNKAGKVENLTIRNRKGANAIMQDFTLNAVLDAALPPMPSDLPEIVDHDRLQITYDIIVY
jgi:hypothetical protein